MSKGKNSSLKPMVSVKGTQVYVNYMCIVIVNSQCQTAVLLYSMQSLNTDPQA